MDKKIFMKYISGFVLGDGALSSLKSYYRLQENGIERESKNGKKKNSHYYIKQLSVHSDYMDFQQNILSDLTEINRKIYPSYIDKRGYKIKEQIVIRTKYHPMYTKIRERVYLDGHKQIDPHYLKLWDIETLCYLYLDDGWLETNKNKDGSIYLRIGLSTHSFTYMENLFLKKWMKEKFDFNFDVSRQKQKSGQYKYFLRNSKDNSKRFLDKIYKYSFPSFEYKFFTERSAPYKG